MSNKIKVAYCFCGQIITASVMPFAEIDKETRKLFLYHAKKGHKIDFIDSTTVKVKLGSCDCKLNKSESKQLSLLGE